MVIDVYILMFLFATHWLADFVCQTDKMAKGKSTSNVMLLKHTLVYSLVFLFVIKSLWFFVITFVTHTMIDYVSSRWSSKLWKAGDVHNFFVVVGLDQTLHYIQLVLTYVLLNEYGMM